MDKICRRGSTLCSYLLDNMKGGTLGTKHTIRKLNFQMSYNQISIKELWIKMSDQLISCTFTYSTASTTVKTHSFVFNCSYRANSTSLGFPLAFSPAATIRLFSVFLLFFHPTLFCLTCTVKTEIVKVTTW